MAGRARLPPICNSARPGRGGCRINGDAVIPPRRPICSPTPRPGSTLPISSSSIRSAPAIAASSRPARTCARGSSRSTATSIRSRSTIRRWLEKSDRLLSPKFVAGESYGGIRGPKVVRNLQIQQGVGVRGLILVSPVLDFREFTGSSILQYVVSLPTMAAVAREAKGAGHPRRHGRRRTLCARRISRRSRQGRGRYGGHHAACRQGRGADWD